MKSIRLLSLVFTLATLFIVLAANTSVYSQGKGQGKGNAKGANSGQTGNKSEKANRGSDAAGANKNRNDSVSSSDNNGGFGTGNPKSDVERKTDVAKSNQNNGVRDGGQGVGRGKGQGKGQGATRRELKGQNSQVRSGNVNTPTKRKIKKKPGK